MYQRTVEIGHTYVPQRFVPLSNDRNAGEVKFRDTPQAARLRAIAEGIGSQSLRVAFVDDVVARNQQRKSREDSWRHALFIGVSAESVRAGTGAELVAFESAYELRARQLVDEIRKAELPTGYRLSENGRHVVYGSGKDRTRIPLEGFKGIEDPTHPSCPVLDLAWLEKRLEIAPEAVTILPDGYQRQQQQVAQLAGLFTHLQDAAVESVFVS